MFATVREATFDAEKRAQGRAQVEEFSRLRSQQPGYKGALTVDAGDGHIFSITLWETAEQGRAAQATLDPHAQRLMVPLMSVAPRVLGSGEVSYDDITRG